MGRGKSGSGVEVHKGTLRIRFTYDGKRYHEPTSLKPTTANIKAVERIAAEVRQKIALGVFDYPATFPSSKHIQRAPGVVDTVTMYAETWLKTLTAEKSTRLSYTAAINKFWLTEIGDKALTAIRHTDIATAIAKKAQAGATGKTTNNLLIPIRALFESAVADGKVEASPVTNVHNRKHQKPQPDPFTRDEMDAILRHMDHYPETVLNYFQFAFTTGMRTSELIALRWGDIDWNRRTVTVSRAQVRHVEKGTKTHQVRDVDLSDLAMGALTAQKAHSFMRGPDAVIFCSPDGKRWLSERRLREAFFKPCLRALGLRQRKAYNTRHTYATVALMAGVNPSYIARQLGHANTAMLFKHYAKWIEGADSGLEAGKLNRVFGTRIGPHLAPEKHKAN